MIIRFFLLLLTFFATVLYSQDNIKSIEIVTPKDWMKEVIQLPPKFAPDMKFKGKEDIRFAPGMFIPDSSTFFTYVFLLEGKCGNKLDQKTVESEIMAYYKGLAMAVGAKRFNFKTDSFELKLNSLKDSEYTATLDWIEPFKTGKKQILNLKIFTWQNSEKHFLFAMVSPAKTDSEVWTMLNKVKDSLIIKTE